MSKRKRKNSELLAGQLQSDEVILWTGHPRTRRLLTSHDWYLVPFTLIWCTIAYGALINGLLSNGIAALGSLFIPHLWIAMWLFPGRFIYEYFNRRNTLYIVTSQRLMILTGLLQAKTKSIYIDQLPEIDVRLRQDGSGTLIFKRSANQGLHSASTDFYDLEDARAVYKIIQQAHNNFYQHPAEEQENDLLFPPNTDFALELQKSPFAKREGI